MLDRERRLREHLPSPVRHLKRGTFVPVHVAEARTDRWRCIRPPPDWASEGQFLHPKNQGFP
jgi:hypothetical protein